MYTCKYSYMCYDIYVCVFNYNLAIGKFIKTSKQTIPFIILLFMIVAGLVFPMWDFLHLLGEIFDEWEEEKEN